MPRPIDKAVFTYVEALCNLCKPVYVPGKIEKAVFAYVEALRSLYSPVYVLGKIEEAVFNPCGGLVKLP